ncbi:MlaD family protein [Synechococcus sp. M16CYN]|uniref:MlaD family protein n=1 Tax=Synechococcus sp. M16CYN TaxID=3103139 RepID=UPI003251DE4D
MRRSVRDAIVGFTIIGGIVGFVATAMWMRGISLGSSEWKVIVHFNNAAGLTEHSPVTYRGILVGAVRSIKVTSNEVVAELAIAKEDLRLALPVAATAASASLLGGDAQVTLVSHGKPLLDDAPLPKATTCNFMTQLCDGAIIAGRETPSIATVTDTLQELLLQVKAEELIPNAVASLEQIDAMAKSFETLTLQLQAEAVKIDPVLRNLQLATAYASNIAASLDNPETLSNLRKTANSAAQLTARIDSVGGDVEKLTSDPAFMQGLRNVTIGLGAMFSEAYSVKAGE